MGIYQQNMSKLLTVICLLGSLCTSHVLAKEKLTVCSATINSDNEIKAFKAALPKSEFEFIELTENSTDVHEENWFAESCKAGIKCDILLISGHFGGTFFGESGHSLSLETLETAACQASCPGILQNPSEVFLLGCNTLSDKNADHRSVEEYTRILMNDGLSRNTAERVAAFRYLGWGEENRDRMRKVFNTVPRIYGFSSTGPLGQYAEAGFKKYLSKTKKNYANYIRSLRVKYLDKIRQKVEFYQKNQVSPQCDEEVNHALKLEKPGFKNKALFSSLKQVYRGKNLRQFSGLAFERPSTHKERLLCKLRNDNVPRLEKLQLIYQLLSGEGSLAYLPNVEHFFRTSNIAKFTEPEKAAFSKIQSLTVIRDEVLELLENLTIPKLKIDLASLSYQLNWKSKAAFQSTAHKTITKWLSQTEFTIDDKDALCSIEDKYKDIGKGLLLGTEHLHIGSKLNKNKILAIGCLKVRNKNIEAYLVKSLQNKKLKKDMISSIAYAIGELRIKNDSVIVSLIELLKHRDTNVRSQVTAAIRKIKPNSQRVNDALIALLKDKDDWVRSEAIDALGEMQIESEEIHILIAKLINSGDVWVQNGAIEALGKLQVTSETAQLELATGLLNVDDYSKDTIVKTFAKLTINSEKVMNHLISLLKHKSIRAYIASIIGNTKKQPLHVQVKLADLLKDDNYWVRAKAVEALGNLAVSNVQLQLKIAAALKDKAEFVRINAKKALEKIKPSDEQVLRAIKLN